LFCFASVSFCVLSFPFLSLPFFWVFSRLIFLDFHLSIFPSFHLFIFSYCHISYCHIFILSYFQNPSRLYRVGCFSTMMGFCTLKHSSSGHGERRRRPALRRKRRISGGEFIEWEQRWDSRWQADPIVAIANPLPERLSRLQPPPEYGSGDGQSPNAEGEVGAHRPWEHEQGPLGNKGGTRIEQPGTERQRGCPGGLVIWREWEVLYFKHWYSAIVRQKEDFRET
jgi:hypothetical protein